MTLDQAIDNIVKAIQETKSQDQIMKVLKKANRKLQSKKPFAPTSYADLMDEAYEDEFSLELKDVL